MYIISRFSRGRFLRFRFKCTNNCRFGLSDLVIQMEVKVNREVRDYTEGIFFGLSLRQFICSILACGVAVGLYFGLRNAMGMETVSWMCIVGASPFAALGFIKYHGMTSEQFIWAWLKSEFLTPRRLTFGAANFYQLIMDNYG